MEGRNDVFKMAEPIEPAISLSHHQSQHAGFCAVFSEELCDVEYLPKRPFWMMKLGFDGNQSVQRRSEDGGTDVARSQLSRCQG